MAKLTILQPFRSVGEIKTTYRGITLAKPYEWRLIPIPYSGTINGLPSMQGVAVATNGILVAIMQQDGMVVGHLDYFVADEQEPEAQVESTVNAKRSKVMQDLGIQRLFETF